MYLLLGVMCIAPVFYSLFGSANLVLKTSGNERYSFYALLIVLLAEAVVNGIFIEQYGLKAAVLISWTSILLYTLLLSFVHRKLSFYNAVTGFLSQVWQISNTKMKSGIKRIMQLLLANDFSWALASPFVYVAKRISRAR